MEADRVKRRMWLFTAIPVLLYAFPHIFLLTGGYYEWIMPVPREVGFVENATAFFFVIGGVYAFYMGSLGYVQKIKFLKSLLYFTGTVAIWVALEEVSYGQHFLHFNSPEWFLENNHNKEINIHNLGKDSFSHLLRTLSYVLVGFAGIVVPLFLSVTDMNISSRSFVYYFIPYPVLMVPSFFQLFANLPKTFVKQFQGGDMLVETSRYFSESGEYEEYMLGVWVIMYLVMVHMTIRDGEKIKIRL